MVVPKSTESKCRNGSVQARQVIVTQEPHLYILFFGHIDIPNNLNDSQKDFRYKRDVGMELLV